MAQTVTESSPMLQFIEETYELEMNNANISLLNRAITHGAEHGIFSLPKGISGKVKLAAKARKASPVNEVCSILAIATTHL